MTLKNTYPQRGAAVLIRPNLPVLYSAPRRGRDGRGNHRAGDLAGAWERHQASLAVAERLAAANPGSAEAQRDIVASLWRLASLEAAGVAWKDVLARMEAMRAAGTLFPADEPFLEQARQRAAETTEAK